MNPYVTLGIYIALGLIGAYAHYFKKRYKDKTTACTLMEYIVGNLPETLYSLGSMVFGEMVISAANPEFSMTAIMLALTTGFVPDSVLNKSPDAQNNPPE
jgi:hypothetical protein